MALTQFPELIENVRDSSGDVSQKHLVEYYDRIGHWADAAVEEAQQLQTDVPELKQVQDALDYLVGLQWKESMPSYRAKPVSNEILAMFWETIGLLTDIKPMFNIKDVGAGGDFSKIESIQNRLAKGWAANSRFSRTLAFCTMFGMLTTAPAKIYWNPQAHGYSGDPADGDISFECMPASSLLRLGEGDDLQDDECVIYRKVRTLDWIKRAYPRMGQLVKPQEEKSKYTTDAQAPVTVMPQLYQTLGAPMKRLMGGSQTRAIESVYPKAEVLEFWKKDPSVNESRNTVLVGPKNMAWSYTVKPGQLLYPRGRVIVRSNGVTLYDEPNPYYHRKFPFALLGLYSVPWQQYAMSVLAPWMKQQDILNQILSGVLQVVKKAVNPALMAPKNAIHPEALRAIDSSKPNLKISYSQNAGSPPIWQTPPNLPGYVLQTYGLVQTSMKQSSGAQAVGDASSKKQVPGGDTLDRITFSKNTPIRMMGRNIEYFVDEIGGMWNANALQFYDASKRMELLGAAGLDKSDMDDNPGSLIPGGMSSEAFIRRWQFKCDKGTLLNVQRQDRIQISFALRKNHDMSRKKLYEQLDWNINLEENDKELAEEAAAIAKAQAAAGVQPGGKKHK
jgi:hypothetical protein